MASTNHTTNYNLSQFLGTDKPAWLSDYNGDMGKIDTAIKNAADTATGADGKADTANTAIGTLTSLTTTDKTSCVAAINEVNTAAGTAQSTANGASLQATTNATNISKINGYLNITSYEDFSAATSSAGAVNNVDMHAASNAAGTLGKVYGYIDCTPPSTGAVTVTLTTKSNLRPTSQITINSIGVATNGVGLLRQVDATIGTDGTLSFTFYADDNNKYTRLIIHPCLLFMVDFGDVPTPE